jgi:hypothetical protein
MADFSQFPKRIESEPGVYESALQKALDDRDAACESVIEARDMLAERETRVEELTNLIGTLVGFLPAEARAQYLDRIHSKPPLNANAVISDKVIQLFEERKQTLAAPEIKGALEEKGISTNLKSVQNSLSYLEGKRRLMRLSRGQYYMPEFYGSATREAAVEDILTAAYGPPTFRGHPPGSDQLPPDY